MAASDVAEGARVVVTGGTGVLGSEIVRALARRGARVGITFHEGEAKARALADELPGLRIARADLRDPAAGAEAVARLAQELDGPTDALVHAAATTSTVARRHWDALDDVSPDGWDALFSVNVRSAFFAARRLLPHFPPAPRGANVVLVGSVDGVKALPAPVAYAASKAALSGLARSLAKELGPRAVRVNVLAPGLLEAGASEPVPADLRAEYVKHASLKRVGTCAEAARAIAAFTLTNTYVTGQTFCIDGGL